MNARVVIICVVLPCIIALVASAYIPYGSQYAPRNVAPYQTYAANSFQAAKQARLYNWGKLSNQAKLKNWGGGK